MRAVGIVTSSSGGDGNAFIDFMTDPPLPGPDDLLVGVRAVAVHKIDTELRRAKLSPVKEPKVLGWSCAGVVVSVGSEVRHYQPGDEVFYLASLERSGCNAELHVVDQNLVGRKPRSLNFAESAGLPLDAVFIWEVLHQRLSLLPGRHGDQRILLLVNSAIATTIGLQLAGQRFDLESIVASSQLWEAPNRSGAADRLDSEEGIVRSAVHEQIDEVSYVVGEDLTEQSWSAVARAVLPGGHISISGTCPAIDGSTLARKNLSLHFYSPLFPAPSSVRLRRNTLYSVADLIDSGRLVVPKLKAAGKIDAQGLMAAHRAVEFGPANEPVVLEGF